MHDQRGPTPRTGSPAADPFAELVRIVEDTKPRRDAGLPVAGVQAPGASPAFEPVEVRAKGWDDFTYEAERPEAPDEADELYGFEDELEAELEGLAAEAPAIRGAAGAPPRVDASSRSDEIVSRGSQADGAPAPTIYAASCDAGSEQSESDIEVALRGLSEPARPRDHVPVVTQSFAPDREHDHHPAPATTITLDDFDELIASELAAMRPPVARRTETPHSLEPAFGEGQTGYAAVGRERFDAPENQDFEEEGYDEPLPMLRRRSSWMRRTTVLAGSIAATALVGVFAYAAWTGMAGPVGGGGEPLLIKADLEPVKIAPVDPGGKAIPNQNKAVYERVASNAPLPPPVQQTLVTASEEPMDIALEGDSADDDLPGVSMTRTTPIAVGDMVGEPEDLASMEAKDPMALEPRKVRTLVVRPDGTLVAEDAIADPAVPGARGAPAMITASSPNPATADSRPAGGNGVALDPVAGIQPAMPFGVDLLSGATAASPATAVRTVDVVPAAPEAPVASAAVPAEAPVAEAVQSPPAEEPQIVASIAPPPEAPLAVALPAGGYYVQISSQPSEALAKESMGALSGRYASTIGGRSMGIQSADIPGKGTYYRVRIATGSKDEANTVCAKLQSAGGSCFVTR